MYVREYVVWIVLYGISLHVDNSILHSSVYIIYELRAGYTLCSYYKYLRSSSVHADKNKFSSTFNYVGFEKLSY